MARTPSDSPYLYEPLLGILHFKMLDGPRIVHCMVSEAALRSRAASVGRLQQEVEALFEIYRPEVESLAAKEYARGMPSPIVRAANLTTPPPLTPPQVRETEALSPAPPPIPVARSGAAWSNETL